jgi:Zn-finger nucleic acid-binding protein
LLDDRICPGCKTPTLADRPERLGVLAGLCTTCERLWLDAGDLAKLVGHVPETRAPLIPPLATRLRHLPQLPHARGVRGGV